MCMPIQRKPVENEEFVRHPISGAPTSVRLFEMRPLNPYQSFPKILVPNWHFAIPLAAPESAKVRLREKVQNTLYKLTVKHLAEMHEQPSGTNIQKLSFSFNRAQAEERERDHPHGSFEVWAVKPFMEIRNPEAIDELRMKNFQEVLARQSRSAKKIAEVAVKGFNANYAATLPSEKRRFPNAGK